MRLSSFRISNFKSIIDSHVCKISSIDNVTILAGQNESGKSSVLEALNFFGNGASEVFKSFHIRIGASRTEVQCTFLVNETEKLNIMEKFQPLTELRPGITVMDEVTIHRVYENGIDSGLIVDESFYDNFPTTIQRKTLSPEEGVEVVSEIQFRTELVDFVLSLVPSFSLYNSFNDLLPSRISIADLPNNKAIADFEKVFGVNLKTPLEITDTRVRKVEKNKIEAVANDDFNESWSQSLTSLSGDYKYKFNIEFEGNDQIVFMIEGDDGIPLYVEQKSLGFRWFSAFHLRLKALRKASSESGNKGIIILIDEPGQNLHDAAQKDAKRIINDTAVGNTQIIYSTHNPNLIGDLNTNEIEFTRIRIVSNSKGTSIKNISQFMSSDGSLDALSPIRTAMGLNSTGSLFNKEAFNIVVEGITDNYYFTAFREHLKFDDRISFIPVCGVDNVKALVGILIGWGMNYKAVFDDDPQQGRKAYNEMKKHFFEGDDILAHEHILKLQGMHGVEDIFSKHDFHKFVYKKPLVDKQDSLSNSQLAKLTSKELLGRQFLESIRKKNSEITLEDETKENIAKVFNWLQAKFNINADREKFEDNR